MLTGGGAVSTGGGGFAMPAGGFAMPAGGYAMPPGGYAMQAGTFLAPSSGVAPTAVAAAPVSNGAVTAGGVPTPPTQFIQYVPLLDIQRVQTNVASSSRSNTLLQTAQGLISSTTTQEKIRILFDICAQKSFINEDLCKRLNSSVVRWDPIILNGFQSENDVASWVKVVRARLYDVNRVLYCDAELHVVPKICSAISQQTIEDAQAMYPHLNGLPLADCTNGDTTLEVQVLIGGNQYWNFVSGKVCRGPSGPVAMETIFGWVLSGNVEAHQQSCSTNLATSTHVLQVGCELEDVNSVEFDRSMVDRIHDFWDTENLGLPSEEDRVMQEFNESIFFDGKNYHVPILFRCDPSVLPDNYSMCVSRLRSLFSKLQADPNLLQIYDDIIRQQETDGVIEAVDPGDPPEQGEVSYMPHRIIVDEDRQTTKHRIIHDASAHLRNQPSINECLEKGKNFLPDLFSMLVRVRCHRYALTSDISKAFLNIRIREEFRNYFRFLWFDDINKDNPEIVIKRFTSVLFGLKQSPYLLNATIQFHMEKFVADYAEIVIQFLRDLYMDDNVTGFEYVSTAFDYYVRSKSLMKQGGFVLRKWTSNNDELMKMIAEYEINYFGENSLLWVDKILGGEMEQPECRRVYFLSVRNLVRCVINGHGYKAISLTYSQSHF